MRKEDMLYTINELTKECQRLTEEIVKLKSTIELRTESKSEITWKPSYGEEYYFLNSEGRSCSTAWVEDRYDKRRYLLDNCFETREDADRAARVREDLANDFSLEQLEVLAELKSYADDDKEWDGDIPHFYIDYITIRDGIVVEYAYLYKTVPFSIYFSSEEQTRKAIDAIGKENLKKYYFCVEE